jgi:hypothetical protein
MSCEVTTSMKGQIFPNHRLMKTFPETIEYFLQQPAAQLVKNMYPIRKGILFTSFEPKHKFDLDWQKRNIEEGEA